MSISKIVAQIVLLLLFVFNSVAYSQTVSYNVLPDAGRNELFHTYLMEQGKLLWDTRRADVASSLTSIDSVLKRQTYLRNALTNLLGDFPEKTPLNPVVTSTLYRTGYKVEKIHYQSVPNHHVTANFYIPTTGSTPYPTVIVPIGHYPEAKVKDLMQDLCILFATHGIAALIVDPICQGERYQVEDTVTGKLIYSGGSGTTAHTRLDVGAVLTGTSIVAYELWDNIRGVDYLYSRTDVVDTAKVGCTGSSGGGVQATYLTAYDNRIKVAAVNSYLTSEEALLNSPTGPQTGSQNLSYEGIKGIDHPDFITMFAPKPFLILAATKDFFPIEGTKATYAEAKNIYNMLGESDKIKYFEENNDHGYKQKRREEAVKWFCTWFYNDSTEIVEPAIDEESRRDLWITKNGKITDEFADEKTVTDLNIELADSFAIDRKSFWQENTKDSCLNKVKELIRLETYAPIVAENVGTIDREKYTIEKIKISSGDEVPVTGLLFIPKNLAGKASTVLYVDGRGKDVDAIESGVIEQYYTDSNKVVFSIDIRGFGETSDNPAKNESKHGNLEHRNAVISLYIGKTLIGQRVGDMMKAIDYLYTRTEIDTNDIQLVGIDRAGPATLHTVALDSRINSCKLFASHQSWVKIVKAPAEINNMTHEIPSALKFYDLTDLSALLSPGSITYYNEPYVVEVSGVNNPTKENIASMHIYPNPVIEQTSISYDIKKTGFIELKLFDTKGQEINNYIGENKNAGKHTTTIDVSNLNQGVYFYQLFVDGIGSETHKMLVSK